MTCSGGGTRTRVNLVMSQIWNHLQSRRVDFDDANIQHLHGCRKINKQKNLFFLFFFFFLENKSIYRSLLYTFFLLTF